MALDATARTRLQWAFPKIGVPSNATDWLEGIAGSDTLYVDEVAPNAADAAKAAGILRAGGIPLVYAIALERGVMALDEETGDPNPTTSWFVGATAA